MEKSPNINKRTPMFIPESRVHNTALIQSTLFACIWPLSRIIPFLKEPQLMQVKRKLCTYLYWIYSIFYTTSYINVGQNDKV